MSWFRNLSLSVKLNLAIGAALIVFLGVLIGLNLNQLHRLSLSNGESFAMNQGEPFRDQLSGQLSNITGTLETVRDALLSARAQKRTRAEVVSMLEDMLIKRGQLLALYTAWEPDAFDGKDKANAGKTGYEDESGRFNPYVAWSDSVIHTEAAGSYNTEGAGDYYLVPKKTKKAMIIEPSVFHVNGKATLMAGVSLPIVDVNGQFLGVVGGYVLLTDLQEQVEKTSTGGMYISIVSEAGKYISNGQDAQLVLKPYADTPDKQALLDGMRSGTEKIYTSGADGGRVLRVFKPVEIWGLDGRWYIESVVPEVNVLRSYYEVKLQSLLVAAVTLLLMMGLIYWILRRMVVRNLKETSAVMAYLAEGDFTQTLPVRGQDEFGRMAEHINFTIGKLRDTLRLVADTSTSVGATSQQLHAGAEQTGLAAEAISGAVQQVAEGAETQNMQVDATSQALAEMTAGLLRVAESTAAIADKAKEVTGQTDAGSLRIQEAVRQMDAVQQAAAASEAAIQQLKQRTQEVEGIIDLIGRISMQTNMLALNASIEASRAGEHGRGFAVVAEEVRKLAEQTKGAAGRVAGLLEEIRHDTDKTVQAIGEGNGQIRLGVQSVTDSGLLFGSILAQMEDVNRQIEGVSSASDQMSAGSRQVSAAVQELADIAKHASSHAQNVAASSEEQLASMEEISSASTTLSQMVQELLDQLAYFKV